MEVATTAVALDRLAVTLLLFLFLTVWVAVLCVFGSLVLPICGPFVVVFLRCPPGYAHGFLPSMIATFPRSGGCPRVADVCICCLMWWMYGGLSFLLLLLLVALEAPVLPLG
jgi:hypothetical protein